jgi:hypothetical protein
MIAVDTSVLMAIALVESVRAFGSPLPSGERSICQRVGAKRRPMINSANRVRGRRPHGETVTPHPALSRRPLPMGEVNFRCAARSRTHTSRYGPLNDRSRFSPGCDSVDPKTCWTKAGAWEEYYQPEGDLERRVPARSRIDRALSAAVKVGFRYE